MKAGILNSINEYELIIFNVLIYDARYKDAF